MADQLSFKIKAVTANNQSGDSGGNWQYVGADAMSGTGDEAVKLVAMKRDNSTCGVAFPASMLTATIIFASTENGVSDNMTIQGLHDLASNNEIGSVSSASPRFAAYIGGRFSFDFKAGVLSVWPRDW